MEAWYFKFKAAYGYIKRGLKPIDMRYRNGNIEIGFDVNEVRKFIQGKKARRKSC